MIKYYTLLITFLSLVSSGSAQTKEIETLVLKQVNLLRDSLNVQALSLDQTLRDAAHDQAFYMAKRKKLTHYQETFTKETPAERIKHYGGNRTYSGENVASSGISKDSLKLIDRAAIANKLFASWYGSAEHYNNMVNPNFTKMGLSYHQTSQKRLIYAAQVFSSNEIELPKIFKNPERSWGVRPAEFDCKDEAKTYSTLTFANGVTVHGRDIYFYFHDIKFFYSLIQQENDGLAIDVILREQLPCSKENQFHISDVYDGNMLQPVYLMDILRNNQSGNDKKIYVKIGELPDYLTGQQWQPNVIIINDNKLCDYSYPVEVPSAIFPLLPIDPYYEEPDSTELIKETYTFELNDTLTAEIWYENSKKEFNYINDSNFLDIVALEPFVYKSTVDCYASVNGAAWYNQELLLHRENKAKMLMSEFDFSDSLIFYNSEENWALMNEQVEVHAISALQNKTRKQIKSYLKKNKNTFLDSLLFEQRKTKITAFVDTFVTVDTYRRYLLGKKYGLEIPMDSVDWNSILREDYILDKISIEEELIDSLINSENLKTNLLGAASINSVNARLDSLLVEEFLTNFDTKNDKQVFNYAHFLTKYWFSRYAYTMSLEGTGRSMEPEELRELIYKMDLAEIDSTDYIRLEVNTLLAGIHYYVTHNNWTFVDEYFDRISELVRLEGFTPKEATELALFCNHFHKFDQAVKILRPFHDEAILTEDGYFVLAKTASLIRTTLENEEYWVFMNSAKRANQARYCKWLDTSFQIQRDEYIKRDFCNTCN